MDTDTEQHISHLTDAIGDLSHDQRETRLSIRELRTEISQLRESVVQVREVQVDHTARLANIEKLLVQVLARLPERPAQ